MGIATNNRATPSPYPYSLAELRSEIGIPIAKHANAIKFPDVAII